MGIVCKALQVGIWRKLYLLAESAQDGVLIVGRRQCDVEQLVQPAGSKHGWINQLGTVRRSDHKHAPPTVQPIHLRQQLVHHALAHPPPGVAPTLRTERVELVEEDDAGATAPGAFGHDAQSRFGLAHVRRGARGP